MANSRTAIEIAIVDGATRVLNEIRNGTRAVQSSFTELNSALELVTKGFAAIGALAGFAKDLLQPARDAETAMQRVAVATGATAEELQVLRDKAGQVAFDLRVPFEQVAAGMEQLARDGASAEQVLQNISAVTGFAKSALVTTAQAAGQLSDILDGYGEDIANVGAIGDAIVATASAAGFSAKDLTEALVKLGPTANAAGLNVNATAALLGVLAENGRGGGRAIKELETILLALKDPTSKAGEAIKALGLDAANLPAVFQRLATDSKAAEAVLEAFGPKVAQSLKLLLSDGGGSIERLNEIIANSGGASAKAAGELGDTFDGAVARIGIALEELKASFFDPILDPLADEIDAVSAKIKAFAGTQDFAGLQAVVIEFVNQTVAQLQQFAASFDFSAAVESTRRFVEDTKVTFALLGEVFGNARKYFNAFLVGVNGLEFAISKLVEVSARYELLKLKAIESTIGLTDAQTEYKLILQDVIESAKREAEVNKEDLGNSLGIVTGATQEAAAATLKLATEQRAAAVAAKAQAVAQQEVTAALPPVVVAVDEISLRFKNLADSAKEGGKEMKKAAETPVGTIDELRQKLIILNQDLVAAFKSGGNTKELQAEIKATEAQVLKLDEAANAAAASTATLGNEAATASFKIADLGGSARKTSQDAAALASTASASAGAVSGLASESRTAANDLGSVSAEFANLLTTYAQFDLQRTSILTEALNVERNDVAERLELIQKQISSFDPLEKAIARLRSQYRFAGDDQLKMLAEAEIRLKGINKERDAARGPIAATSSLVGPGVTVNLSLSALDPKSLSRDTLLDLARQISSPLRSLQASGA